MNHDYTPKEIADATVQASYQHPELRGLDIPPVKAILDALPEPTIMPRIDFARNSYVYQYEPKIMPKKTWLDHMIDAFKQSFKPQPKRQPITKVRREVISNSYGTLTRWNWRCNICGLGRAQSGWWIAMDTATRHARNHHRSEK